jgi:hypothetical protein
MITDFTIASISPKLQLANKRKKLFIYRRGAHGLLKEGAPSGGMWAAKWGSTSFHLSSL